MPRNANGTYTLPSGNPVVGGTYITTTWANPTMDDIAAALSDSLSRSGQGGMNVPFKNADGNIGSPGITWQNEVNTGFYRFGSQDMRASVGGVDRMRWNAAGVQTWSGTSWSGVLTQAGLDLTLANYALLTDNELVTGAWSFSQFITAQGLLDATAIHLRIGGTDRGVFTATGLDVTGIASQGGVALALSTRSITGTNSLAGGGNLTADRTLTLLNDVASPGSSWYYGTDAGGAKGYHPLSGVVGVPEAPVDGTSYARNSASWVAIGTGGVYLPLSGGTMTGQITLPGTGTGNQAASVTQATNAGNTAVAAHVAAADPHTQYLLKTGGAISGALTIGTTLGVTGAATFAATTHSGIAQFSNQVQCRSGNGVFFYDSGNTANVVLALDNTTKQLLVGTKGGVWYWDTGQTFNRGGVTVTTVAPVGNDPAKAGDIVLVYE